MTTQETAATRPPNPLIKERSGYRAICLPPPANGSWSSKDLDQMRAVFTQLGIKRGVVPNFGPPFSGRVAGPSEEQTAEPLGNRLASTLVRFVSPCEGGWLDASESLVVPAGGCLICVASGVDAGGDRRILAFHAGLQSLVEFAAVFGMRDPPSVLGSVADAFKRDRDMPPQDVSVECFFSLPPDTLKYDYDSPACGELHRGLFLSISRDWGAQSAYQLYRAGYPHAPYATIIDPAEIFLAQAKKLGFKSAQRSCDLPPNGPFAYTRHADPCLQEKRNLAVILPT